MAHKRRCPLVSGRRAAPPQGTSIFVVGAPAFIVIVWQRQKEGVVAFRCESKECFPARAVAGRRLWSALPSAAPQASSTRCARALQRVGSQKQACGSCAQLVGRCECLQPATREPKLAYTFNRAPAPHVPARTREIETPARDQLGSHVARLPVQRLYPAWCGCYMATTAAPEVATAAALI